MFDEVAIESKVVVITVVAVTYTAFVALVVFVVDDGREIDS